MWHPPVRFSLTMLGMAWLMPLRASAETAVPPELFHCIDRNLEVTVWAQSPLLFNPTNIDIDQHGRIWVAEGVNYRYHFNRRPEGDRIVVLEDTDGDGKADKSWTFVQEPFLRAPMGVAVIGNKVVVSMAPDLIVYTDHNGDGVFDPSKGDTREVLLTGFSGRAHDHSLHSVTVGPDGKWYFSVGNCGAKFTDREGKTWRIGARQDTSWWPKDPERPDPDPNAWAGQPSDDGKVYIGGFIACMNPDGTGVEILAHNLRNSYENCVTSYGDIFANDNDDAPASRTFWVLPGGNYGFASADGARSWQADRRPGQSIMIATWRQEDPGVAPAGDVYGAGAPTGIVFYENGALGPQWEGTLLSCDPALNSILGYKPEPHGEGWKLERFVFLTTNKEGQFRGTDSTGGNDTARVDEVKTLFRPSDIAVGPDGALYIADWYDPRVGGHADLDNAAGGAIYRVAPKGFKSVVPKIDVSTEEGARAALKNPAVHVRALGAGALRARAQAEPSPKPTSPPANFFEARERAARGQGLWAEERRRVRWELVRSGQTWLPADVDPANRADLESWGAAVAGREAEAYVALLAQEEQKDPKHWSERFAALAWRLHPPQSVAAFKERALAASLPEKARVDALTAIGFNFTSEAAAVMLDIAAATKNDPSAPPLLHATALWWLLHHKDRAWKDYGLAAALKERGLYDPDTVEVVPVHTPEPPPPAFSVADVLALKGDPVRGQAASQRCLMCHRIGEQGAEFGPELTGWGRTQPTEVILRAIIEPSADIAHGFEGYEVETTSGELVHGVLLSDGDPLMLRTQGGLTQALPASKIRRRHGLRRSLMLSATQLGLTAQEVADIAAFLKQ